MDFNTSTEIQGHLNRDEKLIWAGQPKQGVVFRIVDFYLIPFSILWCGFAIFWLIMAMNSGAPLIFPLFGIPFVIVGLFFVFGRFIVDSKYRANTFYGVTNERIIIKSGLTRKSIKSLNIRTLSDIEYTERKDGSGTITIGPKNPFMIWGSGMNWWPGVKPTPSLDMIQDVGEVYNRILELQKISV